MHTPQTSDPPATDARISHKRKSLFRYAILLIAGTLVLFGLLLTQRNHRIRDRALGQASWHASVLATRLGTSKLLPLNLKPDPTPDRRSALYAIEWASTLEARSLRSFEGSALVSWTVEVTRLFASSGRAVVFFEQGRFRAEWLTSADFDLLYAAQKAKLDSLSASAKTEADSG